MEQILGQHRNQSEQDRVEQEMVVHSQKLMRSDADELRSSCEPSQKFMRTFSSATPFSFNTSLAPFT
eukprot:3447111-Rhodomonas_salina.1